MREGAELARAGGGGGGAQPSSHAHARAPMAGRAPVVPPCPLASPHFCAPARHTEHAAVVPARRRSEKRTPSWPTVTPSPLSPTAPPHTYQPHPMRAVVLAAALAVAAAALPPLNFTKVNFTKTTNPKGDVRDVIQAKLPDVVAGKVAAVRDALVEPFENKTLPNPYNEIVSSGGLMKCVDVGGYKQLLQMGQLVNGEVRAKWCAGGKGGVACLLPPCPHSKRLLALLFLLSSVLRRPTHHRRLWRARQLRLCAHQQRVPVCAADQRHGHQRGWSSR